MSARADRQPRQLNDDALRERPLPLHSGGDKFARGTALVIGGAVTTPGAVRLSGEACLRMGAGRLQLATTSSSAPALGVAVPEALVLGLPVDPAGDPHWPADDRLAGYAAEADAIVIGPGLSTVGAARELLEGVLRFVSTEAVVVVDAIALRVLADLLDARASTRRLVLTPNRQELAGLCGGDEDDDDVESMAVEVAERFSAVVTCFGTVTTPSAQWRVRHDVPGLGTSGSGDVLTGLVAGAAARCADSERSALWGTFVHHATASRLASRLGPLSFLARDLVSEVPAVLAALEPAGATSP